MFRKVRPRKSSLLIALFALGTLLGVAPPVQAKEKMTCVACCWMPCLGYCCVCGPNSCLCCEVVVD
jgi:hypothetical protein